MLDLLWEQTPIAICTNGEACGTHSWTYEANVTHM